MFIFLQYDSLVKIPDIIELLAAERAHFLQLLMRLNKELKDQMAEPREYPADLDISEMCWEAKTLKTYQMQVSHTLRHYDGHKHTFHRN